MVLKALLSTETSTVCMVSSQIRLHLRPFYPDKEARDHSYSHAPSIQGHKGTQLYGAATVAQTGITLRLASQSCCKRASAASLSSEAMCQVSTVTHYFLQMRQMVQGMTVKSTLKGTKDISKKLSRNSKRLVQHKNSSRSRAIKMSSRPSYNRRKTSSTKSPR